MIDFEIQEKEIDDMICKRNEICSEMTKLDSDIIARLDYLERWMTPEQRKEYEYRLLLLKIHFWKF